MFVHKKNETLTSLVIGTTRNISFSIMLCFPLHFMFYRGNLDYFSVTVELKDSSRIFRVAHLYLMIRSLLRVLFSTRVTRIVNVGLFHLWRSQTPQQGFEKVAIIKVLWDCPFNYTSSEKFLLPSSGIKRN